MNLENKLGVLPDVSSRIGVAIPLDMASREAKLLLAAERAGG